MTAMSPGYGMPCRLLVKSGPREARTGTTLDGCLRLASQRFAMAQRDRDRLM